MSRRARTIYIPPQEERHHYVFLAACGCPFGLTEATARQPNGPPRIADEDAAWDDFYDTRREERAARGRGVHVRHVDHAEYEREYYRRMSPDYRCPHGGAR